MITGTPLIMRRIQVLISESPSKVYALQNLESSEPTWQLPLNLYKFNNLQVIVDKLAPSYSLEFEVKSYPFDKQYASASISVSNIRSDVLEHISEGSLIWLKVGYGNQLQPLFVGKVKKFSVEQDVAEQTVTFECVDNSTQLLGKGYSASFVKGTRYKTIFQDLISLTTIPIAYLEDSGYVTDAELTIVPTKTLASQLGNLISDLNERVTKSLQKGNTSGLMFFSVAGNFYLIPQNYAIPPVVVLSKSSGLLFFSKYSATEDTEYDTVDDEENQDIVWSEQESPSGDSSDFTEEGGMPAPTGPAKEYINLQGTGSSLGGEKIVRRNPGAATHKIRALLIPDIIPDGIVSIEGQYYRVVDAVYKSGGGDHYVECLLQQIDGYLTYDNIASGSPVEITGYTDNESTAGGIII